MQRLIITLSLVATGCALRGDGVPHPFPRPEGWTASAGPTTVRGPVATSAITQTALALQGTPYHDSGNTPDGFDCSGFTRYVFSEHGISLPRLAADQYRAGTPVQLEALQPGDLVFFTTISPGASHVGVSIGGEEFVHAPGESNQVRVDRLSSRYWAQRYVGARRMVE